MPAVSGNSAYGIFFGRINATNDGANTVLSGTSGKKIRVLSYAVTATGAGACTFQDSAGSPAVAAGFSLAANGGVSYAGGIDAPAFELASGLDFVVSTAASQDITGHFTYQLVD